nr:protein suppressor of max2 1 [Quercus suber]
MREASFSSPAVKATIEQSLNSPSPSASSIPNSGPIGLGFRGGPTAQNRNLYLNPRLQQQGSAAQLGHQRGEEVKRLVDILLRSKKRNPVLVGESEPEAVVKELLRRIENKELGDGALKNAQVIHWDKEFSSDRAQIPAKVKELGDLVDTRVANSGSGGGVIVNLGDLKWMVEQPVYHPSMENDWDLQAVPIAPRAIPGMFPRLGINGILSSSVESLSPLKGFTAGATAPRRLSENLDPARRTSCCPQCMQNYEQELAKILPKEFEKSSSEVKSEAARPQLPQWLQNAKAHDDDAKTTDQTQPKDQELISKQRSQDLLKKWIDTCFRLHPSFHHPNLNSERIAPVPLSIAGLYNPNVIARRSFQPKLQMNRLLGETLQPNTNQVPTQPSERAVSPPDSPVRTDLILGRPKVSDTSPVHKERIKDFLGCMSSESQNNLHEKQSNKLLSTLDADSFKKLVKGLMEKVWWQQDAASALATSVTQCKVGNGKQRGAGSRGDMWILFTGPDRVGKKKMASALSELVSESNPIMICLGSRRDDGESDLSFRGKTALDRIAEAVRRNPFSVIMLEDIDEADTLIQGSIKRAMERGRLADSHGREISLGNVIFILTANWLPDNLKYLSNGISLDEDKLASLARGGWHLRLSLCARTAKRRAHWLHDEDRPTKPSKKDTSSALAFDLNEAANVEDERADNSHNSSDLTIDHEYEHGLNSNTNTRIPMTSAAPRELLEAVDDTIVFKPVNLNPIRRNITSSVNKKFTTIIGDGISIEVQDEALEKITSGVWLGRTSLEEWTEKALAPSFHQLKACLPNNSLNDSSMVVRLEIDTESDSRSFGDSDYLPSSVKVVAKGL